VLGKYDIQQGTSLFRISHPATLQIVFESLMGRQRNNDRFETGVG